MSGYEGTIRLAREKRYFNLPFGMGKGDWLRVVKACYEEAIRVKVFAGSWIVDKVGWFPSLRTLSHLFPSRPISYPYKRNFPISSLAVIQQDFEIFHRFYFF